MAIQNPFPVTIAHNLRVIKTPLREIIGFVATENATATIWAEHILINTPNPEHKPAPLVTPTMRLLDRHLPQAQYDWRYEHTRVGAARRVYSCPNSDRYNFRKGFLNLIYSSELDPAKNSQATPYPKLGSSLIRSCSDDLYRMAGDKSNIRIWYLPWMFGVPNNPHPADEALAYRDYWLECTKKLHKINNLFFYASPATKL